MSQSAGDSSAVSPPASESARHKRLGEIALQRGLISDTQLSDALKTQQEMKKLGLAERIGQILFKKQIITQAALDDLLKEQKGDVRRLGNFEIYEKVGAGAMGVVFRAKQISMDRIVALKILAPKYANDEEFIKRFVREARSAGQFSHENIVTALDVGYAKPYHYFAMEYVEGETLRALLKERGCFEPKEALRIAHQVAQALDHALQKGIIHRDIKPDNVILTKQNIAKVLDLGLACAVGAESGAGEDAREKKITGVRKAIGTPHYISPEAARAVDDLDTRTDLYSLGCTLYHLLTGETPFDGKQPREIMAKHVSETVPDVRAKKPGLNQAVAAVVGKLTARDRDERYANPGEVLEDLKALMDGKRPNIALAKKAARGRTGLTTGPRVPISGKTTGPRAPVKGQGTTGPRRPIHGRTTGPAIPVKGDRTGNISVKVGGTAVMGNTRNASSKKGNSLLVGGIVGGVVVVAVLAVALSGGSTPATSQQAQRTDPAPVESASKPTPTLQETPTPQPRPKKVAAPVEPSAEERAREALLAAQDLRAATPNDFSAAIGALERARDQARDTPVLIEIEKELSAVRGKWQMVYDLAFDALRKEADAALAKKDYRAAHAAYADDKLDAGLRVGEWRAKLEAARKDIAAQAEAQAAAAWKKAQALAEGGKHEGLTQAIEVAAAAEKAGWPVELAPSAGELAKARAAWQAKLAEAKKAAQSAAAESARRGAEMIAAVQRDLAPLLAKNRYRDATELLDAKSREPALSDAKPFLQKEKADIAAVVALREDAVKKLRSMAGEKITLLRGTAPLSGTIQDDPARPGVTLKLADGPELTIAATQLNANDVGKHAPPGKDAGEDQRRRGLLFLYAGEWKRAKDHFVKARDAGLGAAVEPYLQRIEIFELGEAEVNARKAWVDAVALVEKEAWKEALDALSVFEMDHAGSKAYAEHKAELAKHKLAAETALNPLRPGLLGYYFKDEDFKPEKLKFTRTDPKVDFDWKMGGPDPRVGHNDFSIRWEGVITIAKAGEYTFATESDDGARLWINNQKLIDEWGIHPRKRNEGRITLEPGVYPLRMEYYEKAGGAVMAFFWVLKDGFGNTVVPPEVLQHKPIAGE